MKRIVEYLEKGEINFYSWFTSFTAIIAVRFFVETLLTYGEKTNAWKNGVEFLGLFIFFLMSYVIFWGLLKLLLPNENLKRLANVLLWGQWVVILPPFVDYLAFGRGGYLSFYVFDGLDGLFRRYFLFFGDNLSRGITLGVRMEVFLVLALIGVYLYVKGKNFWGIVKGLLLFYTVFYILGVFPSLVTLGISFFVGNGIASVTEVTVAKTFFSPFNYFSIHREDLGNVLHYRTILVYNLMLFGIFGFYQYWQNKQKFWALFKNIRFPQMAFNWGLFLLGMGLGYLNFKDNLSLDFFSVLVVLNLMLAIFSAWFYSVFVNDLVDKNIDKVTNVTRPLVNGLFSEEVYKIYGNVFLFFSLLTSLAVGTKFLMIILIYHALTWVYSSYPFRLKRFVGVATFLSSFASMFHLIMGYILLAENQSLALFPWKLGVFLFIAYFLVIPLKDLKDIEGDRKDGVFTLPVLLGEEKTRLVLGSLVLINYLTSVFVVNEKQLFAPALICGGISFWVINDKKSQRDWLLWKVLSPTLVFLIWSMFVIG